MTTMIADPPPSTTRLGVGLDSNRRPADREAWKKSIGSRQIPARLALLPEPKRDWRRWGVSAGVQFGILGFCLLIPLVFTDRIQTALQFDKYEIPMPLVAIPVAPPPPPPRVRAAVTPKPVVQPEP